MGRIIWYKLDEDNNVVPCESLYDYTKFMLDRGRLQVGLTEINGIGISTVFLDINHSYRTGKPLVFETALFYPDKTVVTKRYHTWKEAEIGHEYYCKCVRDGIDEEDLSLEGLSALAKALSNENHS